MKQSLYDALYDRLTDLKWASVNNDEAYQMVKDVLDVITEFRVMRYLDKMQVEAITDVPSTRDAEKQLEQVELPKHTPTPQAYGICKHCRDFYDNGAGIPVEKNGKKGAIIL